MQTFDLHGRMHSNGVSLPTDSKCRDYEPPWRQLKFLVNEMLDQVVAMSNESHTKCTDDNELSLPITSSITSSIITPLTDPIEIQKDIATIMPLAQPNSLSIEKTDCDCESNLRALRRQVRELEVMLRLKEETYESSIKRLQTELEEKECELRKLREERTNHTLQSNALTLEVTDINDSNYIRKNEDSRVTNVKNTITPHVQRYLEAVKKNSPETMVGKKRKLPFVKVEPVDECEFDDIGFLMEQQPPSPKDTKKRAKQKKLSYTAKTTPTKKIGLCSRKKLPLLLDSTFLMETEDLLIQEKGRKRIKREK